MIPMWALNDPDIINGKKNEIEQRKWNRIEKKNCSNAIGIEVGKEMKSKQMNSIIHNEI